MQCSPTVLHAERTLGSLGKSCNGWVERSKIQEFQNELFININVNKGWWLNLFDSNWEDLSNVKAWMQMTLYPQSKAEQIVMIYSLVYILTNQTIENIMVH